MMNILSILIIIGMTVGGWLLGKHVVGPLLLKAKLHMDKTAVMSDYYADKYYNELYGQCVQEDLESQMQQTERMMYGRK